MPGFTLLGWIDCHALIGSLDKRAGLFKTQTPGHRILHIRVPRGGEDENDDNCKWAWTTGYSRDRKALWPELRTVIDQIERGAKANPNIGALEHGRIYLDMLDAGARLNWHAETGEYFSRYTRTLLPLRTNPGAAMFCGTEVAQPAIGMLVGIEARLPCAAINLGQMSRIGLVIDSRRVESSLNGL